MKIFYKLACLLYLTVFTFRVFAQCTPDNTITATQGTFPASLESATVNQPYSQVIQFKAPVDTMAFVSQVNRTVKVFIDSIRITQVLGLPPGMTYACNNASCMIKGGEVGCMLISGTCSVPGGYFLKVVALTKARAVILEPPFPPVAQSQTDTNTRYSIYVAWPTGIAQVIDPNQIKVYPNPATQTITIEGDFSESNETLIRVMDIQGKMVIEKTATRNEFAHTINVNQLPKGMYAVHVYSDAKHFTKKVLVE